MSRRIQRINQLVRKEMSKILLKEIEVPEGTLATVTRAEITPDLREGKVFVSVLPEKNKDKVIERLNRNIYFLQQKINKRLKMNPVPKLRFVEDKTMSQAGRIEEILAELKKEKE